VEVLVEADKQHGAALVVRDHGCGIPEDLRPRVFEPYITGTEQGNGLGLAIVKRIAQAHGWGIELESQPGQGTTLRLTGLERGQ
jgi:signal transduction histidine kinase